MMATALGQSLFVDNGTTTINVSANYDSTDIGIFANNNTLDVLGVGVVLSNTGDLDAGLFTTGNSMVISAGGSVNNERGFIGNFGSGNTVLVTGAGSAWTNRSDLYVGLFGSNSTLTISAGADVSSLGGEIGLFTPNNSVLVTGTGSTWINAGTLNVGRGGIGNTLTVADGGSVSATTITVFQGSTLGGTGTVNGNLTVNGTLAAGNSSGTFFLAGGNLTMGAGSTWDQEIFSTSVFDVVNVTGGTAFLNGTMNITAETGGSLQYGNQYNFLTASGGITGTFSSILAPSGYRGRLINSGTVAGILVAPSSYTLVAQSPNQARVAGALNGFISATTGDRLTVSTELDQLSAGAYASAFEQIMPSTYSSLPTLAFNTANALNTKLFERIWLMQVAGLSGAAVAGDSPTQNNDNNPLGLKADENWSPFVDANGIFASANSGGTLDTYNAQNGGVTTGGMYKFLPNLMAGAYAGYQYTHAGYDGSTSMEDNAARFGLLASWAGETCYRNTDNIYLNGLVGGQMHNYNVDRQIAYSTINRTANATPTAGEFDSAVQVGYNMREGGFTFGPQASLQYTYLGVNSFNESGADSLDLNVDSFNSSSMMFTLGGQGAYRIEVDEDFAVIPMASASWQHECLQNSYGIQSAFATGGPSESFNFQSSAPLRDFFYGGVGVGFAIGQNWQVSVLWNASAANADLSSQNVFISAAARF